MEKKKRNKQQLRNVKYKLNKYKAEHVISIEETVKSAESRLDNTHSVKHTVDHPHRLLLTLQSRQQITDLERFCGTGQTILGKDKTYNMGDLFVTPTVYKDLSLINRTTEQLPLSFGPTYIQTALL